MSTLITVLITVVACQFVLFVLMLLGKEDDEKILVILCGIWSLFAFTFLRGAVWLYNKLNAIWFNKNYTRCKFYYGTHKYDYHSIYVKNTEIDKLNTDDTKKYHIEIDPKPLKRLDYYMHPKRNKGPNFLNDVDNPPLRSGYSKEYIAEWKK